MTKKLLIFGITFLFTVSCALLKKGDPNNLVGAGANDISSQDIDSDNIGSDSGNIDGLSTVYFSYDNDGLSEETKETLMQNLEWIRTHSEVKQIQLEGHCDSMGSEAYNIGLGRRRAESVKKFLNAQDISSNRLPVISYGEERPLSQTEPFRNRRVSFVPLY